MIVAAMLEQRAKRAPKKKSRSNTALDIYSSPLPAVKIDEAIFVKPQLSVTALTL
jgi:hypothetical protein